MGSTRSCFADDVRASRWRMIITVAPGPFGSDTEPRNAIKIKSYSRPFVAPPTVLAAQTAMPGGQTVKLDGCRLFRVDPHVPCASRFHDWRAGGRASSLRGILPTWPVHGFSMPLTARGRERPCLPFICAQPARYKGRNYPADLPTVEEIIAVMFRAGDRTAELRNPCTHRAPLWRVGAYSHRPRAQHPLFSSSVMA